VRAECHVFLFTDLLLITKNEYLDDNDEEKESAKEKEAEPKRNDEPEQHPSGKLPRYLVKAAEPLNENPIEISPLPPFFLDKATRFPLRLYFSSQRKEVRAPFVVTALRLTTGLVVVVVCTYPFSPARLVRSIDACSQARTSGTTGCSGSSAPTPRRADDPIPSSPCDAASRPPAPMPTKDSRQHSNALLVVWPYRK